MANTIAIQRTKERQTMTVAACAQRGDTLRFVCLDCDHKRERKAATMVAKQGDLLICELRPRCEACRRSGRKGVGLHKPGYGTYVEIIAPGDPR